MYATTKAMTANNRLIVIAVSPLIAEIIE